MKNLFHPFVFSACVLGFVSCTKSVNELPAPTTKSELTEAKGSAVTNATEDPINEGGSKIFPMIYEPLLVKLGQEEGSKIFGNGKAVFFVCVDQQILELNNETARLTISLEPGDQEIGHYPLLPNTEAEANKVVVPEDLQQRPFMFAIVDLEELNSYTNNSFAISSLIINNQYNTRAELRNAFIYISQ